MTDETEQPHRVQQEPSAALPDWFLQSLVSLVNNSESEIGVTLQVSGFLVSGLLVGGAKYFEGFAAELATAFPEDQRTTESIQKAFSSYGAGLYKPTDTADVSSPPPTYIHLKQARFFHIIGTPVPVNRGVWWRGRLSEVSAFVMGTLSKEL
jgi:hypothetical protein